MVASREVELPFTKEWEDNEDGGMALSLKLLGELLFFFLKKYVVPAARRIDADMLGCALTEISEVVSVKQNFKAAAKNVGRQTLKKQVGGSRKRSASKVVQSKSKKRNNRSRRDIFTNVAT